MSKSRVVQALSIAAIACLALAACAKSTGAGATAGGSASSMVTTTQKIKPGTIGFSLPFATAPFYWAAANGLKDQMQSMGYTVTVTNAGNDPSTQYQQLMTFDTEKVQGVVVIAYDYSSVSPALSKLRADGIPVFAIDRDVSVPVDSFLITDNRKAGQALADYVIKQLGGAKAYIIKDYFAINVVPLEDRVNGFMDEMAKNYSGKYEVVGEVGGAGGGGGSVEASIPLYKDILLKHKDANVFILGTDLLAPAAVSALQQTGLYKAAGQPGAPIIVGVDGNPGTLDLIRKGEVTACFSQYPYLEGVWAGVMLDKWIQGLSNLIPSTLYFGGDLVTYDNINGFKSLWGDIKWKQL